MFFRLFLTIFILIVNYSNLVSSSVDSLKLLINDSNVPDSLKIEHLFRLTSLYEYTNTDSSIHFLREALEIAQKNGYKDQEAYALYLLGGLYDIKGFLNEAYKNYFKALDIYEDIDDVKGIGGCMNCIGIVLWEQCEQATDSVKRIKLNKALRYTNKGLEFYKMADYDKGRAVCYMNKGIIFSDYAALFEDTMEMNVYYDSATVNYKKAISFFEKNNDERSISDCYLNLGLLYYDKLFVKQDSVLDKKELLIIGDFFEKALAVYGHVFDKYGISMVMNNLATIYFDYAMSNNGDTFSLKKALVRANKALDYASEVEALTLKYDAFLTLYKIYKALNNYEKALHFHELYATTKDSVHKLEQLTAMEEMEARYDNEKKEQKIKLQAEQNKHQKTILLLLVATIVIVLLMLFYLIKNILQKKKVNSLLNNKNAELEKMNEIQNTLISIISHDLKAPLSAFYSISSSLLSKLNLLTKRDLLSYLDRMVTSSLALRLQLDNLINWSKTQMPENEIKKEELNLFALVEKTKFLLKEFANQKNVKINNDIDDALNIKSDRNMLGIVLNNIIGNAIKFSKDNGVVNVSATSTQGVTTISITDYGEGIKEEDLNLILNENKSIYPNKNGSGLGLRVSKIILDKLGGYLTAVSIPGKQTTFKIVLQ